MKPAHMAPRQPLDFAQIIVAIAFVMLVGIVIGSVL
jgi:hypothetical protein